MFSLILFLLLFLVVYIFIPQGPYGYQPVSEWLPWHNKVTYLLVIKETLQTYIHMQYVCNYAYAVCMQLCICSMYLSIAVFLVFCIVCSILTERQIVLSHPLTGVMSSLSSELHHPGRASKVHLKPL